MDFVRAPRIDAAVAEAFLAALAPAELDALSRARRTQRQVDAALRTGAERQLERKRYAAALAERQFNRVDPDNRLVAGELERRWEAALNEVREAEEAMARQATPQLSSLTMGRVLNDKVVTLTGRLPQIWEDQDTSDAQRKALLRCLVEKVVLDHGERDVALVRIVWRGGAMSELTVKMRVNSVAALTRGREMHERVLELARAGMPDEEIAAVLTADGHRSPNCTDRVLPITVQRIRLGAGIKVTEHPTRWTHDADVLSAQELAGKLNIPVNWLYVQIRQGRLAIDRQPTGAYLFENTPSVVQAVQDLRDHRVPHLDLRVSQPQQEGHQHA